jgi:hypothetical protein
MAKCTHLYIPCHRMTNEKLRVFIAGYGQCKFCGEIAYQSGAVSMILDDVPEGIDLPYPELCKDVA